MPNFGLLLNVVFVVSSSRSLGALRTSQSSFDVYHNSNTLCMIHHASLVDGRLHSPALLELIDIEVHRSALTGE
jgi:hypothetical protein